jgi:Uma2 family endonuclease
MSAEEFLVWHQTQSERYELVDGVPRLKHIAWDGPRMMVGATQAHILLAGNVYSALRQELRGRPCRAAISDGKVVTPRGNYRYPDVTVDCGPYSPAAHVLSEPVLVAEIWSKTTHWIDTTSKLEDYKSVSSMRHILFLSQEEPRGQLWTRDGDWKLEEFEGIEATIKLTTFDCTLKLADLYDGMGFQPAD